MLEEITQSKTGCKTVPHLANVCSKHEARERPQKMTMYRLENGVSEAAFKERLDSSGKLLVVCTEAAGRARGHLPGGWLFFVFNKASERWAPLHLFRLVKGETKPRLFKTVDGVCGYLISLGLPVALAPVREGDGYEIHIDGNVVHRPGVVLD